MIDRTIQLLVVDDDPGLLAVLECGLAQNPDYRVKALDNAQAALKALSNGQWDLLVADYSLNDPQINGIDLLRAARRLPHPPLVVIITAFASLQITLESINLGVHNFLTKPFQMDELFLVVRNAVEAIHLQRENEALSSRVTVLAQSLEDLERQQQALMERLRRLEYEGDQQQTDAVEEWPPAALNSAQVMELRRRRMRDQVAAYLRTGDQIDRALKEQREHIDNIDRSGQTFLSPEDKDAHRP